MRLRALIAGSMSVVLLTVASALSGAPPRVHVAEAVALAIAFTAPALLIAEPVDLAWRWRLVLPLVALGLLAWDIGATVTIAKHELFWAAHVVYPVGVAAALLLLLIHGWLVRLVSLRATRAGTAI